MARILFQTQKIRADWWDDDEWVQIKKLSGAEADEYEAELFVIGGRIGEMVSRQDMDATLVIARANVALVKIGVAKWNLFYSDPETEERHKMPLTERMIRALPPDDLYFIANEIKTFNAGPANDPKSARNGRDSGERIRAVASGDGTDPDHAEDGMGMETISGSSTVDPRPDSLTDD